MELQCLVYPKCYIFCQVSTILIINPIFRQYSQFVIGQCQLIKCGILFLAPLSVALLVNNSADKTQWRNIFLLAGAVALIANVLFSRFSQALPATYTAEGFLDQNLQRQNAGPLSLRVEKSELSERPVV